jgi:hypothetical protein
MLNFINLATSCGLFDHHQIILEEKLNSWRFIVHITKSRTKFKSTAYLNLTSIDVLMMNSNIKLINVLLTMEEPSSNGSNILLNDLRWIVMVNRGMIVDQEVLMKIQIIQRSTHAEKVMKRKTKICRLINKRKLYYIKNITNFLAKLIFRQFCHIIFVIDCYSENNNGDWWNFVKSLYSTQCKRCVSNTILRLKNKTLRREE